MADHRSIVPHLTEPRALMVAEGERWALPSHETEEAEEIRALMQQRYGLDVTVLSVYAGHFTDTAREEPVFIFTLETHGSNEALPEGVRWMSRADLAGAPLADDEQREALERWFAESESGVIPSERTPWERLGWFDEASRWIETQVIRLGWRPAGSLVQLHARGWSTVLRLPTSGGAVYFKAVSHSYAFEAPLTALLAELFPKRSPRVLAIDQERRWLLLADAGEPIRKRILATRDPGLYQDMLVEYAQLQAALASQMERLVATGCPDRRLIRLPALFAEIMSDSDALRLDGPGGISMGEYAELQHMDVARLAERLAAFGIPETLVQEDCHPGHCIAGERSLIFFDWGDSCLGHPFYSLMMALRWGRLVVGYDAATLDTLRDAYLAQWSAYGSLAELREAYALAWRLAPLARALTWYRFNRNQEPLARWQYEDYPPYWLRLFLHGEDFEG